MKPYRRVLLWVAGGLGVLLLAFVLILTVLVPGVMNRESIRARIQAEGSGALGGDLDFERLDLSFFPRPGLVVRGASIAIPAVGQGTLVSVKVCPRILPLLTGRVRILKLQIEQPAFRLNLPGMPQGGEGKTEADLPTSLDKKAASVFGTLASRAPNLEVEIRRGTIDILDGERSVLALRDLDASAVLPPKGPWLLVTCGSNLWEAATINGTLDERDLRGQGHVELSGFRPHLLADSFLPDPPFACPESLLDLRVDVRTDGLRRFHGVMRASVPRMTLGRGGDETTLRAGNMGLSFSIGEDKAAFSIDTLDLEYPRLRMTGRLLLDHEAPEVRLDLEARELDLDEARDVALCLGRDARIVRELFDYVRGGKLPAITFRSRGRSFSDLGATSAMQIEGRIEDGKIHIEAPGLDTEEVNGDVVVSEGILEGRNLEARLGNSQGRDGTLRVGLQGKNAPFHLDILLDADLAEVQPILMRLVKDETLLRELALAEQIDGRAAGRLVLGESLESIDAGVEISELSLSARYGRIPYPLRIETGGFSYGKDRTGVRNLRGTLGTSSFSGLTCRVRFGETPHIEIESGDFRLLMDEIYPWLLSYEAPREELEAFRDVKGWLELRGLGLKGPILRPADWFFETEGTVEHLTVDTSLCTKPVAIPSGQITATAAELSFTGVKALVLDASLDASGILSGYLGGLREAHVDLDGEIGPEFFLWVSDMTGLPSMLKVRTPFALAEAKLIWNKEKDTSFQGDLTFSMGAKASLDLLRTPGEVLLAGVAFQDGASHATLSVSLLRNALGLKFDGDLTHATLDKILVNNLAPDLHLKGDLLLHVRTDEPALSKAHGRLEASRFRIPYGWMDPIMIQGLSLEASEKGLKVNRADLILEETPLSLEGDLGFSAEGIQVDMDLASDGIDWDTIKRTIDTAREEKDPDRRENSRSPLSVEGTVRCTTESFRYGPFTWRPLHATVAFRPDDVRISVTEADLCGVSTLGSLNVEGEDISLDFRLMSKDQSLESTFPCLSPIGRQVTGRFDLTGEVRGKGTADTLMRALQGELSFSARNGSILRDPWLAKVFSVLNVTEILRGRIPDLRSDELPYDSMTVRADLEDGNLVLKEMAVSGPTVGIAGNGRLDLIAEKVDLEFLVAPLRTVDFIVEKTPLVSSITGGKLVTVPVRMKGAWKDPDVTMLSASVVGSRLLGIMRNTLMLPVEILEPVMPRERQPPDTPLGAAQK